MEGNSNNNTSPTVKTKRKHRSKKQKREKPMREEINQPAIHEFIKGNSPNPAQLSAKKRTPPSTERRPEKKLIMTDQNTQEEAMDSSEESESDSETEADMDSVGEEDPNDSETVTKNSDLEEQLSKLSPELRILHELMKQQLDETMTKKLTPLQKNLDRLLKDKKKRDKQLKELKSLTTCAETLQEKYNRIERENLELKKRINRLEDKHLENNLVVHGIEESEWEQPSETTSKVRKAIVEALPQSRKNDRYEASRKILIHKVKRVGRYNSQRSRPISVSFVCQSDADIIYKNKSKLKKGIYIDREYCKETEHERKLLRVIMRAAKRNKDYEGKYKLEGNTLKLNGKNYTVRNLHELPAELNGFEVSSKKDDQVYAFFGELNPLSNFHPSPFDLNGKRYHCSEQFIQYRKAEYLGDQVAAKEIMSTKTALEAKIIGRRMHPTIDRKQWDQNAKDLCYPGIAAKFEQNTELMILLQSTGARKIVESGYDTVWGTGIGLGNPDCLVESEWENGQGILGEILEQVRDTYPKIPVIMGENNTFNVAQSMPGQNTST